MLRLFLQLIGMLALILAPLPAAAAIAPPAAAAAAVWPAGHCAETESGVDQQKGEPSQDKAKHPCCKSGAGGCCPAGASFASPASARVGDDTSAGRRAPTESVPPGSAVAPLTEPPTLA